MNVCHSSPLRGGSVDKTPVTVPECRQRPDLAGPGSPQALNPQRLDPCGVHSEEKTGPEKVPGGRKEISHLWTCLDGGPCSGSGGLARPRRPHRAQAPRGAGRGGTAPRGLPRESRLRLSRRPPSTPSSSPASAPGLLASSRGGRDPSVRGRERRRAAGEAAYRLLLLDLGHAGWLRRCPARWNSERSPGAEALGRSGGGGGCRTPGEGGIKRLRRHVALPLTGPLLPLLPPRSSPPRRLRQQRPAQGTPPPPGRGPGPGPRLPGAAPLGPPRLEAGPCSRRRGQTRPARSRRSSPSLPVPTPRGCLSVPSPLTPAVRLSRKASCLWDLLETAKLVVRVLRGRRGPSSSSWAVITARANIFWFSLCAPLTFALSLLHPSPQASNPAFSREAVEAFRLSQDDIPSEGTEAQAQVGLHC